MIMLKRPAVVAIMGHVDHGKTTMLDWLRKSSIAKDEIGGITQRISAFTLRHPTCMTFLDTPGHAAFSSIRERGALATDIMVLVVDIHEGVKPQTVECINFATSRKIPMVVAANKCDRHVMKLDSLHNQLMQHGVYCEAVGGDTQSVAVSGLTGLGMADLLEAIQTQAEIMELEANVDALVSGVIIESNVRTGLGPCASIITKSGILKPRDLIFADGAGCQIRAILDERNRPINQLTAGIPATIAGWFDHRLAPAGSWFHQVSSRKQLDRMIQEHVSQQKPDDEQQEQIARNLESIHRVMRQQQMRVVGQIAPQRFSYEDFVEKKQPELDVVIRCDTQGSADAIIKQLSGITTGKVKLNIVSCEPGAVSPSIGDFAKSIDASLVTFNIANPYGRRFDIIYELEDFVRSQMAALLPPISEHVELGSARVVKIFDGTTKVAGCLVERGFISRDSKKLVKVMRGGKCVYESALISSLRHLKSNVEKVVQGMHCGIAFVENLNLAADDVIVLYETRHIPQEI